MATSPSTTHTAYDVAVAAEPVAAVALTPQHDAERARASAQAAREIAGSAAWLAWQIGAGDLTVREASYHLGGIDADLVRLGDRLPLDVRTQVSASLHAAYVAVKAGDLPQIESAARTIRNTLEAYRAAVLV